MLLVHPSSTCDVCLDPYTWATPSHTPHAIPCGHVFCLSCLQSTHPSICPLCRKGFVPDRIKKLHVDRLSGSSTEGNVSTGGSTTQEAELLHRLAMVSGENTPDEDVNEVMNDVQRWLAEATSVEAMPESTGQYRSLALYNVYTALHRYRVVRRQTNNLQDRLRKECDNLNRRLDMKEQDVRQARAVESSLVANLREVEDGAKQKISLLQTEVSQLRHENEQLRSKYVVSTNPLPPPPKPLNSEFIESLHRPPTSRTRQSAQSSIPSHINGNNRGNVPRPAYDPVIPANPTFNNSPAVPEHRPKESESLQERKPRPPIMIPGAHPTKKVVPRPDYPGGFPMPPADPADFLARQSDYAGSYFGDPSAHRAAPSSSRWSTEVGTTTRASTYGYPPFPGNVPPVQEDWHSATSRSHDVERPAPALGSLRLYSDATQYPSHHRESPTIEEAARAIGVTGPDFRQNGTSRGRGEDHTSASSSSVNGQANTYPPSTPSVPQANNSLDLHVAPTSPSVLSAPHINGQSLLGLTRPEDVVPPRPEPSPASTWGTVPTPTPHPSNGSSMIDLGLRGLPAAAIGSEVSLGDLGLTNLPPPGVPSGNSVEGDYDLTSLSLGTLSIDDANSRTGIAVDTSSSVESSHSNLTSSSSHHRSREHHVINGHPADSRENSSTRQPNVNDNISRLVRRTSHVPDPEPSGNRSRESSGSSSGTSSRVSSRNESITDLVSRSSRGLRHGSSHETKERGSQGSSDSVVSYDMGISTTSQTMRVVPGPSIIRSVNGHDGKSTKDRRRRVSFGPVAHEIVEVHPHHAEHVEDPSQLMTPKGKPMLYSHSKSSRHQHSASLGEGLGLSLSSSSSASSRQGITNEDDLNLVDQSLMQLVNGESREHSHHRHAHHPSTANPLEQHPVHHVGPRTGYVIYSSGPPSGHVSQGSPSTEPSTLPSTERRPPVPLERRSASDTHPGQDFIMHGNSRDDTIRPRRRASASTATLSSTASSAHGNRHTPHVHSISSTENHYIHHAEEANDLSRRSSKRHRQTPGPEVVLPPSSEYPPTVGGSSLLLSFTPAPPGPNTSAATTADGEPSSIYAPRPVSSRHTSNLFGLWNARTDR